MPPYESLTKEERTRWDDLAHRGVANLAAANEIVGAKPVENVERLTAEPSVYSDETARTPSLSRGLATLRRMLDTGKITLEQFVARVEALHDQVQNAKDGKVSAVRVRGADYIRQKLLEAKRRGDLSEKAVAMAEWFILQNPALVADLAISIRARGERRVSGSYSSFERLMTLVKGSSNDETTVHEILHHLERMMPAEMQGAIRKAWLKSMMQASQSAKTPAQKLFYHALITYHFSGDRVSLSNVPAELRDEYMQALQRMGSGTPVSGVAGNDLATYLLKHGKLGYGHYQHFNPSEFWAVNGSRILEGRFDVSASMVGKIKQWLKEFVEKAKAVLGLKSDAAVIKALDSLIKGDGQFVTGQRMLMEGVDYKMFAGQKAQVGEHVVARMAAARLMEASGETPQEIWNQTGWYKAKDGQWRFEIDDSGARFTPAFRQLPERTETTLGEVLDHDELFDAYPELRDVKFEVRPASLADVVKREVQGWFDEKNNKLYVTPYAKDQLSTTLHELQHWVQAKEGFENGSNPRAADLSNVTALTKLKAEMLRKIQAFSEVRAKVRGGAAPSLDEYTRSAQNELVAKATEALINKRAELAPLYTQLRTLDAEIERLTGQLKILRETQSTQNLANAGKRIDYNAQNKDRAIYADKIKATQARYDEALDKINAVVQAIPGGELVAHELYRSVLGEVEARNVQTRQRFEYDERGFPEETMDVAPENTTRATGRAGTYENIERLPKAAQKPVRNSIASITDFANKALDRLVFTSDVVNRAVDAGIQSARKFERLLAERGTKARELERAVERIADQYATLPEKDKGTGPDSVNQFLFDSTRTMKWGYGQYRDAEMGARFDALDPKSQEFVKSVFSYGDKILSQKKQTVVDYTTSEYDAAIAKESDPAKKAQLRTDKAADLKKFETLFAIREGKPYAPIKRVGDYVVVAKSDAYREAERNGDTKELRKLESDPDHYHVSFTETKSEARALADQLREQGFFGASADAVDFFEKAKYGEDLFGNSSSLDAITRLRSMTDAKAAAGEKGAAALQRLVTDLYLQSLAEGSARKSEMRRRGVAGEVDMLRSFAAQGRADAQFIASVEMNPQVQDAIQEMRGQVARGGNRERKSELMNELMARYDQTLERTPNPVINKITRLSSIYYLATSPAYYLQNLTQPWMMSLPAMAGHHDYGKASTQLFKAYTDLGGVMKSAQLFGQQFDFSKVPADVRQAIQELANRGKIDIGLETELGEFKIDGSGKLTDRWNKVDKGLRIAVQKVEAINRLSTAIAAYRLELAKTGSAVKALDYADRILTETHGDYTGFNAPRAFNHPVGKVALQFRKFQLIQLTFYAKLIRDAFTGADRAMAMKTLAYSLGHTGMMAGVMGLPGYAAVSAILGALFGDDDEEYDLTKELRKMIGDEDIANLIMRGAPTIAGMDLSGKVGAGNMLSIMPFSNADLTTKSGVYEAFGQLLGGAAVGMAARFADGLGLMLSGNWYKGLEQMIPKGFADAIKAARIANEGMTRRNGDVVLPESEISSLDTVWQALGLSPVKQAVVYERQQNIREMDQKFQDRSTEIKNRYTKAAKSGDTAEMAAQREAWTKLQTARMNNGYTRQPISELLKAPQQQAKRERQTVGGVQYNKANRAAVMAEANL